MNLKSCFTQYRERVDSVLDHWLPSEEIHPSHLHQAMRYSTFNGGKRVRPLLVYLTGEALSIPAEQLDGPASAMELIHSYSLVHDDLPAMDDDDLRRGKPTCHKAYDEATAILVGDGLQALAFYILGHDKSMVDNAQARLRMVSLLAQASGSRGMVGGQAIDLASVGKKITLAELEDIADWTEANKKLFFVSDDDSNIISGTGDIAEYANTNNLDRTAVFYHPDADLTTDDPFMEVAIAAKGFTYAPGTINWALFLKNLSGVTSYTLTATQRSTALGKECNIYEEIAGNDFTGKFHYTQGLEHPFPLKG